MESNPDLIRCLEQNWGRPWLVGLDNQQFWSLMETRLLALEKIQDQLPLVLVVTEDPLLFLTETLAAIAKNHLVILADPSWGQGEWQQLSTHLMPNIPWNRPVTDWQDQISASSSNMLQPGSILIPTGGSSGKLKFAVHSWQTLQSAVRGFQQHFQVRTVNAYCTLPLHHVSGFMQVARVLATNGTLALQSFRALMAQKLTPPETAFISLVPTQLQRMIANNLAWASWLRQFKAILLGGGPSWPALIAEARSLQIPLAPCYGMTETAALVAALLPKQFLESTDGLPIMPHATVTIHNAEGIAQPPLKTGQINIQTESLCRGYWPFQSKFSSTGLLTDDIGYLDTTGKLHVLGRVSTKIISGGKNIFPAEVEAAIQATERVEDVCVIGLPNNDWGEVAVAIVVLKPKQLLFPIQEALRPYISRYKHPKHWVSLPVLPRNAQGKVDRAAMVRVVQAIF